MRTCRTFFAGILLVLAVSARAQTRYYKVAEWPGQQFHGDSYVLPLTDPAAIAHAEQLLSLGPSRAGAPIVVANIAAGADGINRDYNRPGHPLWSWHVTEFQGFADFTIEILDGWPTYVENDVQGWIDNTHGTIGFWSYTVVEDITALVPEPAAVMLLGLGMLAIAGRRRKP